VNDRSYLDVIVPDVKRRLAERRLHTPLSEIREAAEAVPAPGEPRGRSPFAQALEGPGVALIAEVKRYSPSRGPIRPDLDVAELVSAYEAGGAAAVSVLTEESHFRGSLKDLRTAAATTLLPLLRKDFVGDPYQVYEARAFGASAILLIAALLDDGDLRALTVLARDLGLDVLLEVHDSGEMARALLVEEAVIGINNRDLRTFQVSLETSLRLAGLVPPDRLLVAESGIKDRADVERLASAGVDAVLVGESLLGQADAAASVGALTDPPCAVTPRSGDPGSDQVD